LAPTPFTFIHSFITAKSFNTYFLTVVEKLNSDTKCPTEEDSIQYITKTIRGTFPGINLSPTTANEIKNIVNSLMSKN
jgi:hypothetical protein